METTLVKIEYLENGIAKLILNDAEHENRLSKELVVEFMQALENLRAVPDLKVLILAGNQEVFCAGASLEMLSEISQGQAEVKDLQLPYQLINFPVPIIAALEGHAVGGGLIIALCCDLVVAAEKRRYGVNFTAMGFTPGMGTTGLLPALVGHHFASEMIYTAKFYKGVELKERGLFNYVVPTDQVAALAIDLANRMAERPSHVLQLLKQTLSLPRLQVLQAAMSREHLMHKICFSHPETKRIIAENYLT